MNLALADTVLSLSATDSETRKTSNPLTFWKEVAHTGNFQKGDRPFSITPAHLRHWRGTFNRMRTAGIDVPVPVEHTFDPEKRRGEVLEMAVRPNSKGNEALFAKIRFRDEETARQLSRSGTSIYVPRAVQDKHGGEYRVPVQHIAITDYPVLNGLDPFEPIMLSKFPAEPEGAEGQQPPQGQQPSQQPPQAATLQSVAGQLGVDPNLKGENLLAALLAAVVAKMPKPQAQTPMPPSGPQLRQGLSPQPPRQGFASQKPAIAMSFEESKHPRKKKGEKGGTNDKVVTKNKKLGLSLAHIPQEIAMALSKKQFKRLLRHQEQLAMAQAQSRDTDSLLSDDDDSDYDAEPLARSLGLSGSVLEAVKKSRQLQIDNLHQKGFILAAAKKDLEERFVEADAVAFSHEHDDGFEATVKMLEANGVVINRGRTGTQAPSGVLALAQGEAPEDDGPLVRNAVQRAKAASN